MYIQARWKENEGKTQIGSVVELDSWATAGAKLEGMYPGYTLQTLNLIELTVEKGDINGPCYLCSFTDKQGGKTTTTYMFVKDFIAAYDFLTNMGFIVLSIQQTTLTYKEEVRF